MSSANAGRLATGQPVLEPHTQAWIDSIAAAGGPPLYEMSPQAARDLLRDEGEAYAGKLAQAGVRVTQARYGGTIHDFTLLNPIAQTPAPREGIRQGAEFLRRALY